jgi:hypothetical protein
VAAADHALGIWSKQVRMMGAGVIGIAAIITLAGLAKPILGGLKSAMETARKAKLEGATLERTEQDMPIFIVGLVTLLAGAGRLAAGQLPARRPADVAVAAAGGRGRRLHPDRRHLCRRRVRLHGGPDRLVQLAGVRHRHPDHPGRRAQRRHGRPQP